MLEKFKNVHELTWEGLAGRIGISRQRLDYIVKSRSAKITIETVMKIKKATGLDPWQYLDGLDVLKKLK